MWNCCIDEKLFVTFVLFYEMLYDVFLLERCNSKFGGVLLLMVVVKALLCTKFCEKVEGNAFESFLFKLNALPTLKKS